MGFSIKFNWVLQIDSNFNIDTGGIYDFQKVGNRCFPLNTAIDFINLERQAIAKIHILEYTNTSDQTIGKFKVIKKYTAEEGDVLTQYWKENK